MSDEITTYFISFSAWAFAQLELFRDHVAKYDEDWKRLEDNSKEWSYQVLWSKIMEVKKIQPVILKFMEYATLKKWEDNPIISEEILNE